MYFEQERERIKNKRKYDARITIRFGRSKLNKGKGGKTSFVVFDQEDGREKEHVVLRIENVFMVIVSSP